MAASLAFTDPMDGASVATCLMPFCERYWITSGVGAGHPSDLPSSGPLRVASMRPRSKGRKWVELWPVLKMTTSPALISPNVLSYAYTISGVIFGEAGQSLWLVV